MITGFDLVDTLYAYVRSTELDTAITGDVYKYLRPLSSDKEDVVINSLAADNMQVQTAVTNINVYVPALEVTTVNGTEKMPDVARMKQLAALLDIPDKYTGRYNFYVQQPPLLIEEQGTGAFYFNLRIEWKNINV